MLSMLKSDYEKTSKFNQSISGWGGEDVQFFGNCLTSKNKFQISRANEIGLFHPFHAKKCPPGLSRKQRLDCVNTKMTHKASTIYLSQKYNKKIT